MTSPRLQQAPGTHKPDITYPKKGQEGPKSSVSRPKDTRTVSEAIEGTCNALLRSGALSGLEEQGWAIRALMHDFRLSWRQASWIWEAAVKNYTPQRA